ncbi:MAG: glycoside hydrolase family 97 catalytic domain-containing protein, partial [Blastocatellia bacterium]
MKALSNARIHCFTRKTALTAAVWVAASANCCAEPNDAEIRVRSPNEKIQAELRLIPSAGDPSVPHLSIAFGGRPVLAPSSLRLDLADRSTSGDDCLIEESHVNEIRNQYQQHPGKRRDVVDHCREVVITLHERAPIPRRWQVALRAYGDGVAFRFQFPDQDGWPEFTLERVRTTFTLPADATAFALPLNAFTTSYEKFYQKTPVAKLPSDWLLGLPLLLELPGTGWAAITEANLTDYAGMYLARSKAEGTTLVSRLSPLPKESGISVRSRLPHVSPWRFVQVADQVGRFVESDLVLNLNAPCAIADVSWIKTGKTTFPWLNGYFEEDVPFEPGLNTATVKYYIDFCAEAGIPYHSLDGKGDTAWYGGPIVPYQGADPTRAVAGLDLPEVLQYARKKGVGLRLWMNWQAAQAHMARAFPVYREWGIEGVMIDFMDRDDQEMVNFLRDLVKTAAESQLTVTLHGSSKPTGSERTFPNLLTSEDVLNLEYDKWDPAGVSPEHEVTVPFTRMLAGPLDFHQGSFRTVTIET